MDKKTPGSTETVSQCHCEEVKRPKQSHQMLKIEITTLLLVARNDQIDYDTVSLGERNRVRGKVYY